MYRQWSVNNQINELTNILMAVGGQCHMKYISRSKLSRKILIIWKRREWVTTLIALGFQMLKYPDFWVGQICSRPPDQPPFFPRSFQMPFQTGKKRGVSGHPPFLSSLEQHASGTIRNKKIPRGSMWMQMNRLLFLVMHVEGIDTSCHPEFS